MISSYELLDCVAQMTPEARAELIEKLGLKAVVSDTGLELGLMRAELTACIKVCKEAERRSKAIDELVAALKARDEDPGIYVQAKAAANLFRQLRGADPVFAAVHQAALADPKADLNVAGAFARCKLLIEDLRLLSPRDRTAFCQAFYEFMAATSLPAGPDHAPGNIGWSVNGAVDAREIRPITMTINEERADKDKANPTQLDLGMPMKLAGQDTRVFASQLEAEARAPENRLLSEEDVRKCVVDPGEPGGDRTVMLAVPLRDGWESCYIPNPTHRERHAGNVVDSNAVKEVLGDPAQFREQVQAMINRRQPAPKAADADRELKEMFAVEAPIVASDCPSHAFDIGLLGSSGEPVLQIGSGCRSLAFHADDGVAVLREFSQPLLLAADFAGIVARFRDPGTVGACCLVRTHNEAPLVQLRRRLGDSHLEMTLACDEGTPLVRRFQC